ncbi:MAG: ATP-binding protein, partial [Pseudoxanthomonas sp.]
MKRQGRLPLAPWLALAAILGTVTALLLWLVGIAGPWSWVALAAAGVAAAACLPTALRVRALAAHYEGIEARAAMAESERDNLQRDLQRHDRLEQQLLLAKQAAESAVLAKGEFLATMSHEIRTPLNGIVPMLDLLSRAALPPDQRDMLNTASASSQQLLRIVDDILDYSKLEANKLELEITGFNLREVLDGVLQLMHRPAENKNIRLTLQLDPAVRLPVRGDPVRMRQVLSNLIGNAVKFTERGAVTVNVRRLGETAAQHLLRFEVRDTGIGIDAETQTRLFSSFSQADASTTRLYGGTGLGLAICKRIIDLMGGRIGVHSEAGRGATFWFEVPLTKVVGDLKLRDTHAFNQGRVLVVSPDARLRQRLSMLL